MLWAFAAVGVMHVVAAVGEMHVVAAVGVLHVVAAVGVIHVVAACDNIIGIAVVADEVVIFVVRLVAAAERNDSLGRDVGCRLDNWMNLQLVYPSQQLDGVSLTFEHHLVNANVGDHCYWT